MTVNDGRNLHDQLHPSRTARAPLPKPARGDRGVAAGRALYENKGRYADPVEGFGELGTAV